MPKIVNIRAYWVLLCLLLLTGLYWALLYCVLIVNDELIVLRLLL